MSDVAVPAMTEPEARKLTEKIRITAHNYADARQKLQQYVAEAKAGNAHLALGYASWQAYLTDVLGDEPMRIARDARPEMAQLLSDEGLSTRAIGAIIGVSHQTVANDLADSTVKDLTVDEPRISHGLDGKTRVHQPRTETMPDEEKEVVTITMERPKLSGPRKKDANILANINLGLNGYVAALDQMIRTGLDDSITAEEAGVLHADLSRSIKELNTIARMLKTRKES